MTRIIKSLAVAAVLFVVCLLLWGTRLLIAPDRLPGRVDAALVLQGSATAENPRIAGAMDLLQQGIADRALLSIPKESYWGQEVPPIARSFLERIYGPNLAGRVEFCETGPDVDSTVQEAQVLRACLLDHHWQSIVVVTSNYHTRRAGIIFRRALRNDPNIHLWMDGVADPEFRQPWWRYRRSAKIWLLESTKLIWVLLGGQ